MPKHWYHLEKDTAKPLQEFKLYPSFVDGKEALYGDKIYPWQEWQKYSYDWQQSAI